MSKLTDAYPPLFAVMTPGHLFYVVDPADATDDPAGSSKVVTGQTILDQLSAVFGSGLSSFIGSSILQLRLIYLCGGWYPVLI